MGFRLSALQAAILGRPLQRKESQATRAILSVGPYNARWMGSNYETFAREGFMGNPYVFACIRQIAMAVAGIPWKVYADQSKKKELPEHDFVKLIRRPNPQQGQGRFFETMVGYLMLSGNNYIERAGAKTGPPDELYCLRPDRTSIIPGTQLDPIAGYTYTVGATSVPFPEPMILHQKFFHPLNDWYGLSPMEAASKAIDQSNQAKAWNLSLLQNGARPTGALSTELSVEDTQYQRLKEMIDEQYASFANAGRPVLLEGGLKWEEMGLSPQDMHWIEGQKLDAREIAMVYNIAPELIGDPESKTFSNYQEARKALYEENVLPLMDWVRDDFNQWLAPLYKGVFIDYDRDEIEALSEDRDKVYARINAAFTAGWMPMAIAQEQAGIDVDKKYGEFYKWQLPVSNAPGVEPGEEPPPPPPPPVKLTELPHPELPATHPLNSGPPSLLPPEAKPGATPAAPGAKPAPAPEKAGAGAGAAGEGKGLLPLTRSLT